MFLNNPQQWYLKTTRSDENGTELDKTETAHGWRMQSVASLISCGPLMKEKSIDYSVFQIVGVIRRVRAPRPRDSLVPLSLYSASRKGLFTLKPLICQQYPGLLCII